MTLQLVPVLVLLGIPRSLGLWTLDKLVVKDGSSVTIPCHYHQMYREHVKYWCRGKLWHTCVRVRDSPGRISITDSPAEQVVTLTLSNLQSRQTGRYWCAIKIGGLMRVDVRTSLELLVTKDALDLWVSNSTVSGTEGGNVSIECFYSDKLKDTEKKWCRSGNMLSCQSEYGTVQSQNAQVHLSDDAHGCFTVTLVRLQREDAGWYSCMAAGIQAPVHLTVPAAHHTPNCTVFPELMTSLPGSAASVNASAPPTPSARTKPLPSDKPQTSAPVASAEPQTKSSVISPEPRTSSPRKAGSPERQTVHPSVASNVTNSLHVWLAVLLTGGILLTAALLVALVWRWRMQHSQTPTIEERTESTEHTMQDDVDLMDYEWTSNSVLELDEEPSTTELL
ncbi:polymeric immunoglobulin receptor [Brachyhypopomus gauderio]|uniref:polymeric immunoglobulin receptor n=1 Tax=Brachyhypopomus gauderio TaxID=698409 RepID=UPI004041880F